MAQELNTEKEKNIIWQGTDGIVYVDVPKGISEHNINKLTDRAEKFLKDLSGEAKILVDMSEATILRSAGFRKKAAKKMKEIDQGSGFKKAAMVGKDIFRRTIVSFVIMASGIKNVKVFKDKEEGLEWLKKPWQAVDISIELK